ncbi:ribosome biogenesis protein [Schizosaccharomyces japonicus yFS275]|uniref:Ribosome biogenesis protein n=1 Tax=Schizosaccharomyces japonicus (strain yFS275 / FY16936) TaxID=402676 RepID=B6K4Y2_SCHJY|nr:ribosome biogenesis protein [Schizosaccharomyces japonicus yFS275]EEB08539.1 ribosome biogenesis protein [Schizosaccharomyces japonicus yFS275]
MSLYTCQTCAVAFRDSNAQRTHWKSDWHHYNLKRKVAQLPHVSAEVFAEKVLSIQQQNEEVKKRANFTEECPACGKTYYSSGAFSTHLESKKHKENVRNYEKKVHSRLLKQDDVSSLASSTLSLGDSIEASEDESEDLETESRAFARMSLQNATNVVGNITAPTLTGTDVSAEALEAELQRRLSEKIGLNDCLFCTSSFASASACRQHMKISHSLFIPEREFLVDEEGLFNYLAEKVSVHHMCLTCGREMKNLEGIRAHMQQKGHSRIPYESEEEQLAISDFYDFTTSYPTESNTADTNVVDDDHDEEWEDASSDSDDSIDSVDADRYLIADDVELQLPSGARVGHRSLARYFRQNLRSSSVVSAGASVHQDVAQRAMSGAALAKRNAVETGLAGVRDGRKDYSASHINTFQDQRRREDFKTKMGLKNNNKKHFRDALLQ